ncbi:MAG TPA: LOG family protein [Devosia sp.]|nr:LOG family protein [Devosia sp.]
MAGADIAGRRPVLAVFASEQGAGDPERASIMSVAGSLLARRGAKIICLANGPTLPVPLVTSARAAGGEVLIVADETTSIPPALAGVPVERIADEEERLQRVASLAQCFVGLPGSLASASDLYRAWVRAGGGDSRKPVVLLNRNRAFEPVWGMVADVVSHSVKRHDRVVVFTDNVEDIWNKVSWALGEVAG